ncbi:MAG: sarcosine oxidase subunit gamma [Paracoccus sp. (in: a-proteobacteria)]|uniref:sarcosine oxidase subunit gamma n=1 Tax=Paracoccus sp. TaxID=267 RepID=UPI0026E0E4BA|nr:sarcosine oxidase subunit gamma [Paracoccus sp. (in: a-proteobacteria)]MDO5622635.1 sarcosine oxidase subunit gamma [Paracoccus sp. (in: a-proteobacteria)]
MTDLIAVTALGAAVPRQESFGPLTIRENAALALASLALRRGAAVPAPFGLTLPGPGGFAAAGDVAAFWTGPDQWMIEGQDRAETDFASALAAQAPGCSVSEQTDGFAAFDVTGPAVSITAMMERLVNLDPLRLGPGTATRTGLHHLSVFVVRRTAEHLTIMGMRSAAGSVWHALTRAAQRQETAA